MSHQILKEEQYVGPYRLEKTLGKGQTGLVKVGVHCITNEKVAIKIVNREKLSENVLQKVEREIAIMKLIEHSNVLGLYDVYENKSYLYLILEHVSGGELFDYLVRKGRLTPKEARRFFKQIISALDFCHCHCICHRDLKPENLLLDDKLNIKVADFGMASLQPEGCLLETSCGSPHYACPEVIRGERYDGRKADVWSTGVILYALLVGALPFDDDNLRNLLEKVKKGVFHIPSFVPMDCQSLLRSMIEVDVTRRATLEEVLRHPWTIADNEIVLQLEMPMKQAVATSVLEEKDLDPDIFATMASLQCYKDRERLTHKLVNPQHNTEKVVYFLLLDRKLRNPSVDDSEDIKIKNSTPDPPRKRTDSLRLAATGGNWFSLNNLAQGSPIAPRRGLTVHRMRKYSSSSQASSCYSYGCTPPDSPRFDGVHGGTLSAAAAATTSVRHSQRSENSSISLRSCSGSHLRPFSAQATLSLATDKPGSSDIFFATNDASSSASTKKVNNSSSSHADAQQPLSCNSGAGQQLQTPQQSTPSTNTNWRNRLNNLKTSFLGSPRFHRRRVQLEDANVITDGSPEQTRKSWFSTLIPSGSLSTSIGYNAIGSKLNGTNSGGDACSTTADSGGHVVLLRDRPFNRVKADLIHALLCIPDLTHQVISNTSFRAELRLRGPAPGALFNRCLKFKMDIYWPDPDRQLFAINFQIITGPLRRFKRLCDQIQALLLAVGKKPITSSTSGNGSDHVPSAVAAATAAAAASDTCSTPIVISRHCSPNRSSSEYSKSSG